MTTTSAPRTRSLLVAAAASIAWTQGCMTYKRPREASLAPNAKVQVRSSVPFHGLLHGLPQSQTDTSLGVACRMKLVEGRLSHTRGDTAHLVQITRLVPASWGDGACALPEGVTLAIPGRQVPAPAIAVRRFGVLNTALFVLGTLAALYATLAAMVNAACSTQRDC
jgi:hypothetical protein